MKKIFLILTITLFSFPLFASDEKPGRFFEDHQDIHIKNYSKVEKMSGVLIN